MRDVPYAVTKMRGEAGLQSKIFTARYGVRSRLTQRNRKRSLRRCHEKAQAEFSESIRGTREGEIFSLGASDSGKEIIKQRAINRAAFRMILDREGEGIIAQTDLSTISWSRTTIRHHVRTQLVERLVVRTVHFSKRCASYDHGAMAARRGLSVAANYVPEYRAGGCRRGQHSRPACLCRFRGKADARERVFERGEFPFVAFGIGGFQNRGVGPVDANTRARCRFRR